MKRAAHQVLKDAELYIARIIDAAGAQGMVWESIVQHVIKTRPDLSADAIEKGLGVLVAKNAVRFRGDVYQITETGKQIINW